MEERRIDARAAPGSSTHEQRGELNGGSKASFVGYYLDESDPDILVLRRRDDSFVTAFSASGATREGIREAAMEDYYRTSSDESADSDSPAKARTFQNLPRKAALKSEAPESLCT